MHIILLGRHKGIPRNINLGSVGIVVSLLLCTFALATGGMFYAGMLWGEGTRVVEQVQATPSDELAQIEAMLEELENERRRMADKRVWVSAEIDALGRKIGDLQAHVTRLNALGDRLVSAAGLDAGEFNFIEPPPRGGPLEELPSDGPGSPDDLRRSLDELLAEMADRERQLLVMESMLLDRKVQSDLVPAGRPVKKGWMSSRWGSRSDPVTGRKAMHRGLDFAGRRGTDVIAVASGVVAYASRRSNYGNLVEIDHGNGLRTRYAHNKKLLVAAGDVVKRGQTIALLGATGRATGPHVHFEVLEDGKRINPLPFVKKNP